MGEVMIHRFEENPLIVPCSEISWMTQNAFNPGVIRDDNGFHMLIRGGTNSRHQECSELGYAFSEDGVKWVCSAEPALRCNQPETVKGVEDPRIVKWNGAFYIFATACHKDYGRIGIWRTRDFKDFSFVGIPLDWEDKDACIIPQSINNKVYLIHRMAPNIWLYETEDLSLYKGWANNHTLLRAVEVKLDGQVPIKIGLAAPPMRLGNDWLVTFHAIFEPFEYRNSFMILDGDNPSSIKYIAEKSILKPELSCEKYGAVPNVCFITGIIDMQDRWYLYWGGADTVICGGYLLKQDIKH